MPQLSVGELKTILKELPDELPVYFRRISPIGGNIEEAYHVEPSTYACFGQALPCLIIEPASAEYNEGYEAEPSAQCPHPAGSLEEKRWTRGANHSRG